MNYNDEPLADEEELETEDWLGEKDSTKMPVSISGGGDNVPYSEREQFAKDFANCFGRDKLIAQKTIAHMVLGATTKKELKTARRKVRAIASSQKDEVLAGAISFPTFVFVRRYGKVALARVSSLKVAQELLADDYERPSDED